MKVKELITRLLDEYMDSEVSLQIKGKFINEDGEEISGYCFRIDEVEHWNYGCYLNFTDWRKNNSIPKSALEAFKAEIKSYITTEGSIKREQLLHPSEVLDILDKCIQGDKK